MNLLGGSSDALKETVRNRSVEIFLGHSRELLCRSLARALELDKSLNLYALNASVD